MAHHVHCGKSRRMAWHYDISGWGEWSRAWTKEKPEHSWTSVILCHFYFHWIFLLFELLYRSSFHEVQQGPRARAKRIFSPRLELDGYPEADPINRARLWSYQRARVGLEEAIPFAGVPSQVWGVHHGHDSAQYALDGYVKWRDAKGHHYVATILKLRIRWNFHCGGCFEVYRLWVIVLW